MDTDTIEHADDAVTTTLAEGLIPPKDDWVSETEVRDGCDRAITKLGVRGEME